MTTLRLVSSVSGDEMVLAGTLGGSLRVFIPIFSRKKLRILLRLEAALAETATGFLDRDHSSFRSSVLPRKSVIDGDLCELYSSQNIASKSKICGALGCQVVDIDRIVEDIRNQIV